MYDIRLTLAQELFAALGWPFPGLVEGNDDQSFPWTEEQLKCISRSHQVKMLGNSIHARVLGLLFSFVFMITKRASVQES